MGELESIRTFLSVADERSFAAAARRMGATPASVTRTVARLEERLGVQLLLRTTRQVSLTAAGAAYAARVRPLAEAIASAAEDTRDLHGATSGLIRISAPASLGVRLLPDVLSQFAILYPETRVALNLWDGMVDILEADFDLAVRVSGPPSDKSTIWRKICPVPRVIVAAPRHLAARGMPQSPDDLAGHACLGYSETAQPETWHLSRGDSHRAHVAKGGFTANNGDLLARLAVNGEGLALLPRFIVAGDLAAGRLVEVLAGWTAPDLWLTLYYPPYDRLPPRVATFSDFFERHVQEAQPL